MRLYTRIQLFIQTSLAVTYSGTGRYDFFVWEKCIYMFLFIELFLTNVNESEMYYLLLKYKVFISLEIYLNIIKLAYFLLFWDVNAVSCHLPQFGSVNLCFCFYCITSKLYLSVVASLLISNFRSWNNNKNKSDKTREGRKRYRWQCIHTWK